MTERKKLTMDRIFSIVEKINIDWTELNKALKHLALIHSDDKLDELHTLFEALRCDFANVITLGQDDAWRFFAQANGFELPDDQKPMGESEGD